MRYYIVWVTENIMCKAENIVMYCGEGRDHGHLIRKMSRDQDHQDARKDLIQSELVLHGHHLETERESHHAGTSQNRDLQEFVVS